MYPKPLHATTRCSLFNSISKSIWEKIISHHKLGVERSEIAFTQDIIASLRGNANLGVWANPGRHENKNGSDIDIFVETTPNSFIWFALQAKVLKLNGRYSGLKKYGTGIQQWDLIKNLEQRTGCISKYLLYNGIGDYKYHGTDICNKSFDHKQFGCSLVAPDVMKEFSIGGTPKFRDIHPSYAQPWRVMTCCRSGKGSFSLFGLNQIKNSVSYYETFFDNTQLAKKSGLEKKLNDFGSNIINDSSERLGRQADFKILIRITSSL